MSFVHILPAKLQCTHTEPSPLSHTSSMMCINQCIERVPCICIRLSLSLTLYTHAESLLSLARVRALSLYHVFVLSREWYRIGQKIWQTRSSELAGATTACNGIRKGSQRRCLQFCAALSFSGPDYLPLWGSLCLSVFCLLFRSPALLSLSLSPSLSRSVSFSLCLSLCLFLARARSLFLSLSLSLYLSLSLTLSRACALLFYVLACFLTLSLSLAHMSTHNRE